jgi:1-aminocyclopropane-1-carboxylate deaminase/D-cysteine desulfhydrase-like pyridoxal-dependent ACC family enzyme
MIWTGLRTLAEVEAAIDAEGERLLAAGRRPYIIPIGGASPLGSQGYVAAARELRQQLPIWRWWSRRPVVAARRPASWLGSVGTTWCSA